MNGSGTVQEQPTWMQTHPGTSVGLCLAVLWIAITIGANIGRRSSTDRTITKFPPPVDPPPPVLPKAILHRK